ncbi:MAG: hypothetical protein JSS69_15640, partial [Acidobacteria bacterium]|nr:hypothetical protein [Acidobacteriota bacterium]
MSTKIVLSDSPGDSGHRKFPLTLWALLLLGAFFTILNLKWPIARNALCYAKASLGLIQNHFNPFAIARDRSWTAGKPIFFTIVAAPLVWLFDVNLGIKIASFLGTAFFLAMAALALPRLNRLTGVDPKLLPLELVFVALNPLFIYQFWSAYPDSLFAGLVVLTFILIDIIATEPERDTRWHIVGLAATILVAIHAKLYGAVLPVMCLVYFLVYVRSFFSRANQLTAKLALMGMFAVLIGFVLFAGKFGFYPLLDFSEGAGFDGYVKGLTHSLIAIVISSLKMLVFAIVLAFHFLLLLALKRTVWSKWALAPMLFISIYVLGLFPFPGTAYNMRYFLPVFLFLAPPLAAGLESLGGTMRRALLGAYGVLAFLLIVAFNFAPAYRILAPSIATATKHYRFNLWLDNLRMPTHIAIREQIDSVNARVPPGSVLYWSSHYYDASTQGLAEHLGVKRGFDIRYVLNDSEIPRQSNPVFLIEFATEEPPDAPT